MIIDADALLQREDSRLTPEDVRRYRERGQWRGVPLCSFVAGAALRDPDAVAVVSYASDLETRRALTYREYAEQVERFAAGLGSMAIGRGDRVAVMLPNRHEFGVAIFAINRSGACYTGIPSTYGMREATHILRTTGAQVLIVQDRVRERDLLALAHDLLEACEDLRTVVVCPEDPGSRVDMDEPFVAWDDVLARAGGSEVRAVAGDVCHIGFTSGTSGAPKGVMNTHEMLDFVLRQWVEHIGPATLGPAPVNLIPSPVGHHSGFLWGVVMSAYLGGTAVFMPRWDAAAAVRIALTERANLMIAAPTFLQDMLACVEAGGGTHTDSWRLISIPGAPIPRGLVPRAREILGTFVCPSWGMTEWGIGISTTARDPDDRVDATDGKPVPGCDIRVVDLRGAPVVGEEGDLRMRGPGLFAGYLDRPDAMREAFVDGWFGTGDRALQSADGFVEIRGRTKDIIIRGGENIPVAEIETLLFGHPDVREVAVVGVADERLGERACAVVVPRVGSGDVTLASLSAFLLEAGISKHYLPERVEVVAELPKTMSGKVRKEQLRTTLSAPTGAPGA